MQNQKILENKINIKFKNKSLLSQSLIHKSFDLSSNNEKLEFLGDRVLGLVLSKKLFHLYPDESEGNLDKKFASLVNRNTCLKISNNLELGKFLILGNTYNKKCFFGESMLGCLNNRGLVLFTLRKKENFKVSLVLPKLRCKFLMLTFSTFCLHY